MRHPPPAAADIEGELQDLSEEVEALRAEVRRLWRAVAEVRGLLADSGRGFGSGRDSDSRDSGSCAQPASGYSAFPDAGNQHARASNQCPILAKYSRTRLTWLQREEVCDQIGKFLARSTAGGHRGSSGRDSVQRLLADHCAGLRWPDLRPCEGCARLQDEPSRVRRSHLLWVAEKREGWRRRLSSCGQLSLNNERGASGSLA